jgi:hypothetical protein
MRIAKLLTTLAVAAMPAVASADHDAPYQPAAWRQPREAQWHRPQTEARYQERNKLAEVSADPRDGRDVIQLPAGDFDYLELRARDAPIVLRDVMVQFADGSVMHTGSRGTIIPGQGRVVDLPRGRSPVVALIADYGGGYRRWERTPARLEVFGVPEHCDHGYR